MTENGDLLVTEQGEQLLAETDPMANKQIHELPPASHWRRTTSPGLAGGQQHHAPRQPRRPAVPGGTARHRRRTIAGKLGDVVSVKDFGAVGDGSADDRAAFQAALDQHGAIYVPAGTYRLDGEIQIKPRRRLFGAGRDVTVIDARGPRAFTFNRNAGAYQVDGLASSDWNRSALSAMTIRMAQGGVRAHGHEFRATGLLFVGGAAPLGQDDPDGWCLDLVDANESMIREVQAGYGGGTAHRLLANGIRLASATPAVNYGDSLIQETSVKLGAAGTVAVLLKGNGTGLINNVLLSRVQVNAPQGGAGITPLAGTNGIKLWNAARIVCLLCDVEVVDVAFEEYSQSLGGAAGACSNNSYIGCFVHYPGTAAYRDSNTAVQPLGDPHQLRRLRQSGAGADRQCRARQWPGAGRGPVRARLLDLRPVPSAVDPAALARQGRAADHQRPQGNGAAQRRRPPQPGRAVSWPAGRAYQPAERQDHPAGRQRRPRSRRQRDPVDRRPARARQWRGRRAGRAGSHPDQRPALFAAADPQPVAPNRRPGLVRDQRRGRTRHRRVLARHRPLSRIDSGEAVPVAVGRGAVPSASAIWH